MNPHLTAILHQMNAMPASLTEQGTPDAANAPQQRPGITDALSFGPVNSDDVADLCAKQNLAMRTLR